MLYCSRCGSEMSDRHRSHECVPLPFHSRFTEHGAITDEVLQRFTDASATIIPPADNNGNGAGALFIRDTHSRNHVLPVLK